MAITIVPTAAPSEPLVVELHPAPAVMDAVRAFADWPDLLLFDSALIQGSLGRYSFLTADPIQRVRISKPAFGSDPFARLREWSIVQVAPKLAELPPFQGGWAGLMGYEVGRCFERVPAARNDEFQLPALSAGLYDWVLAWDHAVDRAWIIAQSWPGSDPRRRIADVQARLAARHRATCDRVTSELRPLGELAPQWPSPRHNNLWSNFSADDYLRALDRVIEYIVAGDIFQANLSQRLLTPAPCDPIALYDRLRTCNPAPFAGLYACDDWAVISASPERFLQIENGIVTTRPIKGTRRRLARADADLFTKDELRESEKDQAENVMIVDLLRNDLSRVCRPGTVRVPQLCGVETYATVQHLVSEICGTMQPGVTAWDVFRAAIPGGSITGAPKVRAMEIIAELEPTARGPYTGSLFYVGADGHADSNLLIRTFVMRYGWLQCGVGGGITAQSDSHDEYEETWHKAAGMLRALE